MGNRSVWPLADNGIPPRSERSQQYADSAGSLLRQEASVREPSTGVCLETELGYFAVLLLHLLLVIEMLKASGSFILQHFLYV